MWLCNGHLISDTLTWEDLSRSTDVQIVEGAVVLDWAEEIFDAIFANDVAEAKQFLEKGQDPNCIILDSLLCAAIEHRALPMVKILIKGGAQVDLAAVVHDAEACASVLLGSRANPDLRDNAGTYNAPLHLATRMKLFWQVLYSQLWWMVVVPSLSLLCTCTMKLLCAFGLGTVLCVDAVVKFRISV